MEGIEFLLYAFLLEAPREGERTGLAQIALLLGKSPPPPGTDWFEVAYRFESQSVHGGSCLGASQFVHFAE
jgi:hypothetical protein